MHHHITLRALLKNHESDFGGSLSQTPCKPLSYRDRLVLIESGQLSINQLQSHTELLHVITPFTIDYKYVRTIYACALLQPRVVLWHH